MRPRAGNPRAPAVHGNCRGAECRSQRSALPPDCKKFKPRWGEATSEPKPISPLAKPIFASPKIFEKRFSPSFGVGRLTGQVSSRASGRSASSGRPWQLDDREELQRLLTLNGVREIGARLGVSRSTVQRAVHRLGIVPAGPGRRRGGSPVVGSPVVFQPVAGTAGVFFERFLRESRPGGPSPSLDLVVARIRALHEAHREGDRESFEDALIAAMCALGLVHQHQRRLRGV